MRRSGEIAPLPVMPGHSAAAPTQSDWHTLRRLFPYLWEYKWRVIAALTFMVGAKAASVSVPLLLKKLVDAMSPGGGHVAGMSAQALVPTLVLAVPAALLVGYGLLRLSTSLFTELRELVFAKATAGAARRISLEVFQHCTP